MVDNQHIESENELMYIYEWVDSIQLSRPKKNISRDFCDGILLAEIIKHYIPKIVDLHNYPPASSTNQKCYNWTTLNNKVFKKIGVQITNLEINDIISCKSLSIERLLQKVYDAIQKTAGIQIGKGQSDQKNTSQQNNKENNKKTSEIQKMLFEKESNIEKLKEIIIDLEDKLNYSNNDILSLEKKVEELTQIAESKGLSV